MTHTPSPRAAPRLRMLGLLLVTSALALPVQAGSVADMFRDLWERTRSTGQALPVRPLAQLAREVTQPMVLPRQDSLALGRGQLAMFVAPGCRSCEAVRRRLGERGYSVELIDLASGPAAREAFELSGAQGVPTVLHGRHMLSGYSDALFERLVIIEVQREIQSMQGQGA